MAIPLLKWSLSIYHMVLIEVENGGTLICYHLYHIKIVKNLVLFIYLSTNLVIKKFIDHYLLIM